MFAFFQKKTYLNDAPLLAEVLQYHTTKIISRFECEKLVPISFNELSLFKRIRNLIQHNIICAKNENGKSAWIGDSGGVFELFEILHSFSKRFWCFRSVSHNNQWY